MGKGDSNTLWVVLLIAVLFFTSQSSPQKQILSSEADLASVVNPTVAFYGQNMYLTGTAITGEEVRIIRQNGDSKDLGYESLGSGTLDVTPNVNYKFYFYMNDSAPSSAYYVDVQDFKGPEVDSQTDVVGKGCQIDTPIYTAYNVNGQVQSSTANAQAVTAAQSVDLSIRIASHSNKCYGMPDAKDKGLKNAVCFAYAAAAFTSVKTNTPFISAIPNGISKQLGSNVISCYEFPVLQDGEETLLAVNLKANGEPTIAHNITVYSDDIAFDLNAASMSEIWGYNDEDLNELGSTYKTLGKIYVS